MPQLRLLAPAICAIAAALCAGCSTPAAGGVGKACDNGACPSGLVCDPGTNTCQESLPGPDASTTDVDAGSSPADGGAGADAGLPLPDGGAETVTIVAPRINAGGANMFAAPGHQIRNSAINPAGGTVAGSAHQIRNSQLSP
jgi:hypothetical protein